MQSSYEAQTHWQKETDTKNRIQMNLDFNVQDILKTQNPDKKSIAKTLKQNKEQIRYNIAKYVSEEVVPQIVKNSTRDGNLPQILGLFTENKINWDYKSAIDERDGILDINSKINMEMVLNSNKSADPITTLYHTRSAVASTVADLIVHSLEHTYLGKEVSEVKSNMGFDGTKMTDYKAVERV